MSFQKKLFCFLLLLTIFSLVLPSLSLAQMQRLLNIGGEAYGGERPTPGQIVGTIISIALSLVGLLFLLLMLYGGYLWMTARGKEEKLTKAKDTLEAAVIGIIITLAAYGISYFVVKKILEATTGS